MLCNSKKGSEKAGPVPGFFVEEKTLCVYENMRAALIILIWFFSATVQAEVYKWVDDKGVVHYEDKPRDGSQAVGMQFDKTESEADPKSGPKSGEEDKISRDEKRRRIADAMEEDRLEKKEARERKKAERKRNKRKCNQLKDKMKRIKNAAGLYKLDKDGNRVILSDNQRSKNEKRLSNQIKKYCH